MTQEIATDYLGHPCKFTEAKEHFSEPLAEAKAMEHRQIKRQVGQLLLELYDRLHHSGCASRALFNMAGAIDDDGELHALMGMFSAHEDKTMNAYWRLAGLVLAAMDTEPASTMGRD